MPTLPGQRDPLPAAALRCLNRLEGRAYVLALRRHGGAGSLWNPRLSRKRPAERAQIVRTGRLPVAALHLAALAVQRMVRGHQARLLVAFATSNEPALRHRAPKACRSAAKGAADRLKQKKPDRERSCGTLESQPKPSGMRIEWIIFPIDHGVLSV